MRIFIKRTLASLSALLCMATGFAQEALRSAEEEYYDFLSLTGITERPALGYRTLSDSVWTFGMTDGFYENEDGTFTMVRVAGEESDENLWKNNALGTRFTLWRPQSPANNFFSRGIRQGIFMRIYGPHWYNSYNTAVPYGQYDGALWQGKGYNTSLTGGLRIEGYGLELTFRPQLSFSQNLDFDFLPGVYGSEYSYFTASGGYIDLVQRYGDSAFWNYDWGDSEIRYTWHSLTVGFGTQNPWLGPAWVNPMLGSNNAAGYPKVDFGLRKTALIVPGLGWNLGDVEARAWVGKLTQSDYFTEDYPYDTMINAISLSYAPSFIPGLTLGINRIFLARWNTGNLKYFGRLFTLSTANDVEGDGEDQKVAMYFDWMLPPAGFEVYLEFGMDDFSVNPLQNPFHTGIYTVGIKQNLSAPLDKLFKNRRTLPFRSEFIFEFNNFEMSQDFQMQWQYGGYYTHGKIRTGYTNAGQSLGAATGMFGNSQYLCYRMYYPKGETLFYLHRFSPNNNYVYNKAVNANAAKPSEIWENYWANFETYLAMGIETDYFISRNINAGAGFSYIYIANRMYEKKNSCSTFCLSLELKYIF